MVKLFGIQWFATQKNSPKTKPDNLLQEMATQRDNTEPTNLTDDVVINLCYAKMYGELLQRAQRVFVENTIPELEQYSFQMLLRIIKTEEADRVRGMQPLYRINLVSLKGEEFRV